MSAVATSCKPRIWVACLHCYNDGRLVGEWVDCTDAADVTLAQLHGGTGGPYTGCEEVWCLDHENIPVPGEMGLAEAAESGEVHEEVGETLWPALCEPVIISVCAG